jgi:polyketide biosynthesis enoyl-CoA hydratase PksI
MKKKSKVEKIERVDLSTVEDGIAVLSLQDELHRNTFHDLFVEQLLARLDRLATDDSIRVCVVKGLPEVFCAGAHQDVLLKLADGKLAAADIVLSKAMLDVPVPTIAAMEGHAVGGGLAFGLCCDVLILARGSRYGCSFMNMGFTPGMGTTRLMQLAVGEYVANEMMFGGQMFRGSHFVNHPGVNYVLPKGQVFNKAIQLARRIAEKPRASLVLLKRYLSLPRRQAFEETRTIESMMHQLCFAHPETKRRILEDYVPPTTRSR